MALYLNRLSIPNHLSDFLAANADNGFLHPLLGAIAGKCGGDCIIDGKSKFPQQLLQNALRRQPQV